MKNFKLFAIVATLLLAALASGAWAETITLSGSDNYTAQDGDVLTGTTSGTVTIDNNASITLSDATITGGIVCSGTATITLDGTNIVNVNNAALAYKKAGIQIGSSGTTLTIKGDGSLTATGGSAAAGIGIGRTWDASVTAGAIVIEGGTINASGGNGIGTGTVGNGQTAAIDGISIKGGTVCASLGKGIINYGSTVTVGYIKIYDDIEMVDASKITETVTYMHGETDVTANKTDYFTIGEDGDRRIIVPKDDNDYTITIADGIEHGTLSVAVPTAKCLETVTVTATPAFGYRFVRLVVKDADDNDVASTNNTFQMPKGGAIVSAEFALGSHGTTEFGWRYSTGPGPEDQVIETIYDGVTTVSIQTDRSYTIRKYRNEYQNTKFRLDGDIYVANIPYAGGMGEFYENVNPTNFEKYNDDETGYYDITLNDIGNDKWYVSILKTVGQMDVISDQTYTGSAITPEPLVIAGSLDLTKGTDYVYSYTNNTNAGTATVRATFKGTYASLGYVEKEFRIVKQLSHSDITIDDIPDQIYTGSAICPEVSVKDGEKELALNTGYSVECSNNVNAGTATMTITGKGDYAGTVGKMFSIVPKIELASGAVQILEDQNGKRAEIDGNYSGSDAVKIESPIVVDDVVINRSFTPDMAATIMLPVALPAGTTVNAEFYTLEKVEQVGMSWQATMTYIGDGEIPQPNTPYAVILREGRTKLEFDLNGNKATVQTDKINKVCSLSGCTFDKNGQITDNWFFTGTYAYKEWKENDEELGLAYAFSATDNPGGAAKGEFGKIKIKEGSSTYPRAKAMRCYLRKRDANVKLQQQNQAQLVAAASYVNRYSIDYMPDPETIDVKFVKDDAKGGRTVLHGRMNVRTGEFKMLRDYDLKGRKVNSTNKARGAYYGKKVLKK